MLSSVRSSALGRYGLSLLLVVAAFAATLFVRHFSSIRPLFLFVFGAVIISSWLCGAGPGWLAVVLSVALVDYFFIPPINAFSGDARDIPWLISFAICAIAGTMLSNYQRRAVAALKRANDTLEARVYERTIELHKANEALRAEIHERNIASTALKTAEAELTRRGRITALGQFAASIAHEVNQPLAGVVTNASACGRWLSNASPNIEEAIGAAERVMRDAHRASEVIVRLRGMVGRRASEEVPLEINKAISGVIDLIRGEFESKHIICRLKLSDELPFVLGDYVELQQVILNLAINAIDAVTSGENSRREIIVRSDLEGVSRIRVAVEDNGPGLQDGDAARIFESFFSTKEQGIGLGLSICRSLVERHGGQLSCRNNPTGGSIFEFTLLAASPAIRNAAE